MLGREIGSYRILEKVGQGGMGIVYKGVHTKLEQEVAIKVLSPQFSQDQHMRSRFFKEAKIQAKFSHPNVVNILNYLENDGNIYLVMEYINGETLESYLKREGKLTVEKAASVSMNILDALDFMHSKGVIHRDIKPSNVMFTEGGIVKVMDFGVAKVAGENGQTRTGMVGSFLYISPEQILGEEASAQSDIYSFGITFYQMVTGRVPFNGDSEYKIMKAHLEEKPAIPWVINSNISKEIGKVILKAIAKNPKDRYPNIKELIEDLRTANKERKSLIIPSKIAIKEQSLKIAAYFNLNKEQFLISLSSVIILLTIFLVWQKPNSTVVNKAKVIPELPNNLESDNSSPRLQIDLGLNIKIPEDIAVEYVLTSLQEKQISEISADDEPKPRPVRNSKRIRTIRTREVSRKEDLKETLRRAFLLPQP
ncbi:MAG TPA: serine/threonine-protein kinase [Thermodesulfobacteriota bacterium]|nr:serine/threonine-protein kinase [Thermodesulfobacteriota bacterium]